jgi:hypothetical protein
MMNDIKALCDARCGMVCVCGCVGFLRMAYAVLKIMFLSQANDQGEYHTLIVIKQTAILPLLPPSSTLRSVPNLVSFCGAYHVPDGGQVGDRR